MFIRNSSVSPAGQLYTYARINSTGIYRKGEADDIIKRAKRGELRTRSIKILSARKGLSRRARPLTARRLFICSTLAFECRVEFLTGPSLCETDCLKDSKNEEGCTQRDRSQFFQYLYQNPSAISMSLPVFFSARPSDFLALSTSSISRRDPFRPPPPLVPFFLPVDSRIELCCFNTDRYLSPAD